jgi:hypothetical protein
LRIVSKSWGFLRIDPPSLITVICFVTTRDFVTTHLVTPHWLNIMNYIKINLSLPFMFLSLSICYEENSHISRIYLINH